jgi:hypothetical protein
MKKLTEMKNDVSQENDCSTKQEIRKVRIWIIHENRRHNVTNETFDIDRKN